MTTISIASVRLDGGTQARAELNQAVVAEYAAALADGAKFPPIIVFYDSENYWPGDGFHRLAANEHNGAVEINADVLGEGNRVTTWDALTAWLGRNGEPEGRRHGR